MWRTRFPQLKELGEVEFYLQAGFLVFDESTGNFRLGVTFYERCLGVGVGVDFKLPLDDVVPAFGAWVDVFPCIDVVRTHQRAKQIQVDAAADGVTIDPRTGGLNFRDPSQFIQSAPKDEDVRPEEALEEIESTSKQEQFF